MLELKCITSLELCSVLKNPGSSHSKTILIIQYSPNTNISSYNLGSGLSISIPAREVL